MPSISRKDDRPFNRGALLNAGFNYLDQAEEEFDQATKQPCLPQHDCLSRLLGRNHLQNIDDDDTGPPL